jgi:hypothetical protein
VSSRLEAGDVSRMAPGPARHQSDGVARHPGGWPQDISWSG